MKLLGPLLLIVVGTVLVVFGLEASDSVGSDLARFFTGAPTDRTVWLLVLGFPSLLLGGAGLMLTLRHNP